MKKKNMKESFIGMIYKNQKKLIMSLLNDFKQNSLHQLSKVKSISNNWHQRRQSISGYLNANNLC